MSVDLPPKEDFSEGTSYMQSAIRAVVVGVQGQAWQSRLYITLLVISQRP